MRNKKQPLVAQLSQKPEPFQTTKMAQLDNQLDITTFGVKNIKVSNYISKNYLKEVAGVLDLKFAFLIYFFLFSNISNAQSWIDKNEDESYVERHECSFVQAGNKFYIFGGRESAQTLDVYNYATNTWSNGTNAPLEFNHFQATTYKGLIWVIGAFKNNSFPNEAPLEKIYIYNPVSNIWIQGPEIPIARRRGGAGLVVYNNKFYVVGGNTIGHNGGYVPWFDEYDPATGVWTILQDAPNARDHFSATMEGDILYAVSGRLSGGPGGTFAPLVDEVDVFDFTLNTWSTLNTSKNLPTPRAGASVVTFQNEIFVIGGEGSGQAYDTVEAYNPVTGNWSSKASLNYQRHGTQAIVSGQGIHIACGSPNQGGGRQRNMEVYNIDNPVGVTLVDSQLSLEAAIKTFNYTVDDTMYVVPFSISNTIGNVGIYISSVTVDGVNFSLQDNYNNRLICPGETLTLQIELQDPTQPISNSNIAIVYNDDQVMNATLQGTQNTLSTENFYNEAVFTYYKQSKDLIIKTNNSKIKNVELFELASGKLINNETHINSDNFRLNISSIASGFYFIKVVSVNGRVSTKKLIISTN